MGREETCLLIAGQWISLLKRCEADLQAAGIAPVVPVDDFAPSIVLAIDEILPVNMVISPKAAALFVSSAIPLQRWWNREAITLAQQTDEFRARNAKQAEPPRPPPPPPPPPTPPPPPEPTLGPTLTVEQDAFGAMTPIPDVMAPDDDDEEYNPQRPLS